MRLTTKKILKEVGSPYLDLWKPIGQSYWIFSYDDLETAGIYETESVYTPCLVDMTLDQWVAIGKAFVEKVQKNGA
ncbi:hypothetical protein [Roseibium aggregatum]|uniref:Uncharacterized protein n=1 Tax=Roseibium aggregatum TaxID=187304 RepID=A0A0M6Y8W0_9HYPH|nr:hypothetical protein [Roseibium aggregatum]CTQ45707.1 hypothetical protein LAL4801_04162 [Roseibium aggregatum]